MGKIIVISGKQGSGKTTTAQVLANELLKEPMTSVHLLNFADALYQIHDFARMQVSKGAQVDFSKKDGELLQYLGTEWGRAKYGQDVWVNILKEKAKEILTKAEEKGMTAFVIVADCRFRNELTAFPDALSVRLECPKEVRMKRVSVWRDNDQHSSEVDLDDSIDQFDLVFSTEEELTEDIVKHIIDTAMESSFGDANL